MTDTVESESGSAAAIAFKLFRASMVFEAEEPKNVREMLNRYAECLNAVNHPVRYKELPDVKGR